jgi:hypothetical protein
MSSFFSSLTGECYRIHEIPIPGSITQSPRSVWLKILSNGRRHSKNPLNGLRGFMTANRDNWSPPVEPDLSFEQGLWAAGVTLIAGSTKGCGALAGPVTAAAPILPPDPQCSIC